MPAKTRAEFLAAHADEIVDVLVDSLRYQEDPGVKASITALLRLTPGLTAAQREALKLYGDPPTAG